MTRLAEFEAAILTTRSHRRLRALSWEIRRACWNPPFRAEARRLANLADARAAVIEERRGLIPVGRRPRWEAAHSGPSGTYHPMVP